MLIFTNRDITNATDESAYARSFKPGGTRLGFASAAPAGGANQWTLGDVRPDADDAAVITALLPVFAGNRPVLLYLHGNNNTPAKCFARCALLRSIYKIEVIGFSWASEGYLPDGADLVDAPNDDPGDEEELEAVRQSNRKEGAIQRKARRYRQAKNNAQDSVDALARFLRLLATARLHANAQPFSVAAHSLGAHFLQYTLDIDTARESLGTAHNVALLAACVMADGHTKWVSKIRPKGQVFIAYGSGDTVLLGASLIDGGKVKLGTEPGPDRVQTGIVRYICFSNSNAGPGGHGYFVYDKLGKKMVKVFGRIFGSERDIQGDEVPRKIYPIGCDEDRLTCYVGLPTEPDGD